MNVYTCIGRVGKDAELRKVGNDNVLSWSLAVDEGYGAKKKTMWFDCSLWGSRAEKLAQYITKGSQLGVSGELGTREYNDKTYFTLRVEKVSLVGGKPQESGSASSERPQRAAAAGNDFHDDDIPF